MQIQKKINIPLIVILSGLNLGLLLTWYGRESLEVVLVFYCGVLINQVMLFAGLYILLISKRKNWRAALLLLGKFGVLAGVFIFAMQNNPAKLPSLVVCYTFQLIILTLSIKRRTKKI